MAGNPERKPVPRYVDLPDRAWTERMQEPEYQYLHYILSNDPYAVPDVMYLGDMPQVPEDQINVPYKLKVGKTEGTIRHGVDASYETESEDIDFRRPKSTRFVRIIEQDGTVIMERHDIDKHGLWRDLPDTGLTPVQLLEQLWGFGESEINEGQQFQNTRKRGRSQTNWAPGYHPKPKHKKRNR